MSSNSSFMGAIPKEVWFEKTSPKTYLNHQLSFRKSNLLPLFALISAAIDQGLIDNVGDILKLYEDGVGSNFIGLQAPNPSDDTIYTLPVAPTSDNQILASTTAGVMTWIDSEASRNIVFTDTTYVLLATDLAVIVDTTGGPRQVRLPLASDATFANKIYTIKNKLNTGNDVTVVINGVDTIDGGGNQVLGGFGKIMLASDGVSNWSRLE